MTTLSSAPSSAATPSAVAPMVQVTDASNAPADAGATVNAAASTLAKSTGAPLVLQTPQGSQTLQAGQAHQVVAEPGRPYKLMRGAAKADNVIATRQGKDLWLRYEDGTSVALEGFYTAGPDGAVSSVLLPGEGAEGYLLQGDSTSGVSGISGISTGGVSTAEGASLVYAHGARDALMAMAMAQGHGALSDAFLSLGDGATLSYLASASAPMPALAAAAAVPGAEFSAASVLGLLGLGAAAALGSGGSGGGAARPPAEPNPTPTPTATTLSGTVVAGPVMASNDLMVQAYTANGALLASAVPVDANGHYTLSYTSGYTGAVLLKLSNGGNAVDYMDEARAAGKDLDSHLFAIATVGAAGQSVTANLTALTTLAAQKLGLSSTQDAISGDASSARVAMLNNAVARFFGLTTGSEPIVELLANAVLSSTGTLQSGNLYGKVLAAFSGAELALGQTTAQVLATVSAGTALTPSGLAFTNDAAGDAARGILAQGASQALQAGVITAAGVVQVSSAVLLNADPAAAPQVLIFADAVTLHAAGNVGAQAATAQVYFKLSVPSADFTRSDITVSGGTLGALTVDASDATLYHATFTPNASDALAAQVSVNAGAFANAGGVASAAAIPFSLKGDTLAPTAPAVSTPAGGVLADGLLSSNEAVVTLQVTLPTSGARAQAGDSVALLLNGAALASPVTHTLTAADIAAGTVTLSVARSALGTDGSKALSVTITDAAGNVSPASALGSFLLDSAASAPTLALTSDSGASASDRITNTAAFSISALELASANASGFDHLQYQLDSSAGAWTTAAAGVRTVPLAGAAEGAHTLFVRQVDGAGNVSAATSQAFKLDTTAPGAPGVALTTDSGTSNSDRVTNSAAFSVGALEAASPSASGFDRLQYQLDSSTGPWLTSAPGATSVTLAGTADGAHTVYVRQVDLAGNASAATGQAFTLDTTASALTVSSVALSADTGTSNTDRTTRAAAQTIKATLSGALSAGDVLEGSLDNGASWTTITSMVTGTAISWTGATLVGSSIVFRITDLAGNIGTSTGATSYVLDTTASALSVSNVTLSADTGTSNTDRTTRTAAQTITATLSAALTTGDVLEGSLDNGATWTAITGMVTGTAISWTGATLVGSSSIAFRVTDLAGNIGTSTGATSYVLDTTASALSVSNVTLSADTGTSSTDHITKTAAQTITATLSSALTTGDVLEGSLDNGATWTGLNSMASGTAINWTGATLLAGSGSGSVAFRVTDLAGNLASPTGTSAYVLDTSAPVVSSVAISGVSSGAPSGSNTALVAGDSVLVSVLMSEAVVITGTPTYALTLDSGPRTASYVSGSGSNTLVFSYTVAAGDSDLSGGVTASAGALLALGGASLADQAGNQASLAVAAIPASANAVHIDTATPIVRNAAVLDGQASLDVTSDLVLDFSTALGAGTAGSIRLVNDANSGAKAGFYGETTDHTLVMYFGDRVSSAGVTTVQTYSSATTQNAGTLSGSVSIVNATGLVTINPLHDLDLANNYHLEIAASSFTNTANGLGNAAFGALAGGAYALDFATVSPGAAGSGSAAVAMTDAFALTPAHTWINITGLGDITGGTVFNVASAAGATAYVIANQNADPLDTVIVADTTNVQLAGFRVGDMLYIDNTVNGRTSSLGSASSDISWTSNASNDGILLDLPAHASFNAFIAIPVAPFTDVAGMNLRIDTLVTNHQIIVG